jgi:hypothetical protein
VSESGGEHEAGDSAPDEVAASMGHDSGTDASPTETNGEHPVAAGDAEASAAGEEPPHYEPLGSLSCGKDLPLNTIVRELRFGRFITLSDAIDVPTGAFRVSARPVALPLSLIDGSLTADTQDTAPSILTVAKALPERPAGRAGAGPDAGESELERSDASELLAAEPRTVKVPDIAELISTRQVVVNGADEESQLRSGWRRRLLGGEGGRAQVADVILTAEMIGKLVTVGKTDALLKDGGVVHLDASDAKDAPKGELPDQHRISHVHAFLSQPKLLDARGTVVDVPLTPEHVTDLLAYKAVTVEVQGKQVTFEPAADEQPGWSSGTVRSERGGPVAAAYAETALVEAPDTSSGFELTVVPVNLGLLGLKVETKPKPKAPPVGFYVPFEQTWTLLGYSRGSLLNTISLAPQEETTIELFTWDKRTNALEQTSASEVEQNIESTDTTKDTTQVLSELGHDSNFKADANFDVHAKLEVVNIGGSASAGGGTSAKDVAKTTTDFIHEQTYKASLRVKASRQSKVSETHEFGSEERTTRRIKNINMCHPLHLDYFEVLVSYSMATTCLRKEAQLVVLLDLPESEHFEWSRRTIRRFEPVLRSVLLDRAFVSGFDASKLLAARDCAFQAVCERSHCDDQETSVTTDGQELDDLRAAALQVMGVFKWFHSQNFESNNVWAMYAFYGVAPPTPAEQYPDPANQFGRWLHLWLFVRHFRDKEPSAWTGLVSLAPTFPTEAAQITPRLLRTLHTILTPKPPATDIAGVLNVDQQALQELKGALRGVALGIYQDIPDAKALGNLADFVKVGIALFDPLGAIAAAITDLVSQAAQKGVVELAAEIGIAAVDARYSISELDDQGLVTAITVFNDAYDAWQKANADLLKHAADTASALDTLANQRDDQIRSAYPLATVSDACEREDALIMHLRDNDPYYAYAVYESRLASESADLPLLVSASGGLIAPIPIGIVNGKLAFPVNFEAIGMDPEATKKLEEWFDDEIRGDTELDKGPDPRVVSLPTPGITLETRLGICSGCDEFITETRKIDLRTKTALAEQQEEEAKRFAARLALDKPDLDDPITHQPEPVITVRVMQESQSAAAAAPASSARSPAATRA